MDCPFCHNRNVKTNKCPICKAEIPVKVDPKAEKETTKIFKKERK